MNRDALQNASKLCDYYVLVNKDENDIKSFFFFTELGPFI